MNDSNNINNNFDNNQNINNGYNQDNNMNNNYNNNQNINNNFNGVNPNTNNGYNNQNNVNYNDQVVNNQMMNNNPVNNMNNNISNNQDSINNNYVNQNQMNSYNQQPMNNNFNNNGNEQKPDLMGAYTVPNNMPNNNYNQNNMNNNYEQPSNQMSYNNYSNDDELLKEFIGKNYDKITTRKFSFSGLFFSFGYMFYRKMFLYGFVLSVIELIIVNFVPATISSIITLVIMVLCGLFVNKLYVGYAKKKIEKIKLENRNKDFSSLKTLCMMNGGTSIGKIFLGLLAEIGVALVIGIIVAVVGFKNTANNFLNNLFSGINSSSSNSSNNNNNNSDNNNSSDSGKQKSDKKYTGGWISTDTSININNEYSIVVPSVFEDNSSSYKYDYGYESGEGVFDDCHFEMYAIEDYSNAENFITGMAEYDSSSWNTYTVSQSYINNITWYWYETENAFGKTYHYATQKDDNVFLLEFEVEEDSGSTCEYYRSQVMNSIRSK